MFQAYLINEKDTLTMWQKFLEFNFKITSVDTNMEVKTCFGGSFLPTWKIENDSLFLIKILKDRSFDDADSVRLVDLKEVFRERCINGRVFAKEINYQINAEYYDNNSFNDSIDYSHYRKQVCFTIKNGKVIDRGIFEDKTEYDVDAQYQPDSLIARYTNWKNFPDIAVDRKVTIEILTDNNGKIIEAHPIKNHEYPYSLEPIKKEGEEIWKQEALRLVKFIPRWRVSYKCGQVVNKEHDLVFLFTKPQ